VGGHAVKLKVAIHPTLTDKNEGGDTSKFVRGWMNSEVTSAELAELINEGRPYCAQLDGDGRRKAANFLCCDVLSVDMDVTGGSMRFSLIRGSETD
jgi:hypothetical protein